ncbi:hypothetical protein Tco_1188036 [Tanacetum coccineum]
MELYMQNKEHGRMILESVKHGPLIWPTIEENWVTRTKKYVELSAIEKIQVDSDLKETNIILQGLPFDVYSLQFQVNTKFLNSLPPEWSKFMTDVKLVRDFHTTNFDQLNAYLKQHELHANEVRNMRKRNQDLLALVANHQMTLSYFNTYQSSYNNPQFQQYFSTSRSPQYGSIHPTQHYSTTYPSTPFAITYLSTPEGHMAIQCPKPKRKRDATWFRDKVLLVKAQGSAYQADDLDAYDSNCDEISIAKVVLMASLSSCGSDVLSEVPHSKNTHNDMLNQSMQEMPYSEQTHLVNYPDNEITSDSNIIPYSQYLLEKQNATV